MRNDDRMLAVRTKFEHIGYSIWNMLLEKLTDAENFELKYDKKNRELWAGDFRYILETELKEIIEYFLNLELLVEENGMIFSPELKKRLAPVLEKREREREKSKGLKRRDDGAFRSGKSATHGVSAADSPQSKVKEIKGKEIKVNKLMPNFLKIFQKIVLENEMCDPGYLEKTIDQVPRCKKEDIEKIERKVGIMENCIRGKKFGKAKVIFHEIAGLVNDSQLSKLR